jgi:uncharacterized protein YyaL (SSP411 family)
MERESFTDPDTAELLNQNFVCIKVDREERPDIDAIYMQAVAALTGRGGWPLSAWLDPEGAPFYGGTYFPPAPRHGLPSFRQVLAAIAELWRDRREEIRSTAIRLRDYLAEEEGGGQPITSSRILEKADDHLAQAFDRAYGGCGQAPKFPQPLVLDYLLSEQAHDPRPEVELQVATTLDKMAAGGIYDQVGGGFHRYSTDESWIVPHFEKMLYDNAQLARCYLHAWQVFGQTRYREVCEETLDYLLDRMRHREGGFFSAEDADSEGREGAFYLWTPAQLNAVLDEDEAQLVSETYGVTDTGSFEGGNILHLGREPRSRGVDAASQGPTDKSASLATALAKLKKAKEQRERPSRDEKIISAWNGLTLAAYSEAARALTSESYLEAAQKTGRFLVDRLVQQEDRLARSWKDGRSSGNGLLEDYAGAAEGLLALYQATFAEEWFTSARALTDAMVQHFRRDAGGLYDTSDDHESLIVRPRSLQDSPTPCGNSLAATVLFKMAAYTGEASYQDLAEEIVASAPTHHLAQAPTMFGQWLSSLLLAESGVAQVALVGPPVDAQTGALRTVLDEAFRPALVTAARPPATASAVSMLAEKEPGPGAATMVWVCRNQTCAPPTSDPDELTALLAP